MILALLLQVGTLFGTLPPQDPSNPPPTIYFITKDGTSYTGTTKAIDIHVADDKGVHYCELWVDGGWYTAIRLNQPYRLSATVRFTLQGTLPKGDHTLQAMCSDAGNYVGRANAITVTRK